MTNDRYDSSAMAAIQAAADSERTPPVGPGTPDEIMPRRRRRVSAIRNVLAYLVLVVLLTFAAIGAVALVRLVINGSAAAQWIACGLLAVVSLGIMWVAGKQEETNG